MNFSKKNNEHLTTNKKEVSKTEILITGATGTTSQYAIAHLVNIGVNVRAIVRTID